MVGERERRKERQQAGVGGGYGLIFRVSKWFREGSQGKVQKFGRRRLACHYFGSAWGEVASQRQYNKNREYGAGVMIGKQQPCLPRRLLPVVEYLSFEA